MIYIHTLTWFILLVAVLTGYFYPIIVYMSFIFVHEAGHFFTADYFGWRTDKIYIYPYGGYSKFEDDINRPLKEELIILLMGPLVQTLYYCFLNMLGINNIAAYHYSILLFNLLPIYPLDGGKLVNILIAYKISYRESYIWTHVISVIVLTLCVIMAIKFFLSLTIVLILILLIYKLWISYKDRVYCFNKFLLERYINKYKFKKIKVVGKLDKMKRDYKHVFKKGDTYCTEKEELERYYKR